MAVDMKRMIADAFFELSANKSVDKITVKDLVESCNISRQTFYYHFQDITEVIEWKLQQELQQMLAYSRATQTPEAALRVFVAAVAEKNHLIPQLLQSRRRNEIEQLLVQALRTYLRELLQNSAPTLSVSYADLDVALDFYAFGIGGLLTACGQRGNIDVEALTGQIYRLLSGKIVVFP